MARERRGTSARSTSGVGARLRRLGIVVLVVVILVVLLDRVGVLAADYGLGGAMKSGLGTPHKPTVTVHGIPFLTQVVRGRYSDIEINAEGITAGPVRGIDADIRLRGVHLPVHRLATWNFDTIPIDHARADVSVPYDEVARALRGTIPGLRLRGSGGVIAASAAGLTLRVRPRVENGGLTLAPVSGSLPAALHVNLTGLPFQLRLISIRVGTDGLSGTAAADHIVIRNGRLVP